MLEFLQQHAFTLLLLQTRNKPAEELLETQLSTSDDHLQTVVNGHQPSLVATFIPKFSLARTKGRSWVLGEHHLHVSNNPLTYDFTPPHPTPRVWLLGCQHSSIACGRQAWSGVLR